LIGQIERRGRSPTVDPSRSEEEIERRKVEKDSRKKPHGRGKRKTWHSERDRLGLGKGRAKRELLEISAYMNFVSDISSRIDSGRGASARRKKCNQAAFAL